MPAFAKHESQAYQKELRIAFGELRKDKFAVGPGAEEANELVRGIDPVKLEIGDISDITVTMSIDDFMNGYIPADFKCRWPSNEDPNRPSNYDVITKWTSEQIRNYRSILVKPLFIIV